MSIDGTQGRWAVNNTQKDMFSADTSTDMTKTASNKGADIFSQVLAKENISSLQDPNSLSNNANDINHTNILAQAQKDKQRTQALANIEQSLGSSNALSLGGVDSNSVSSSLLGSAKDSMTMLSMRSAISNYRLQEPAMPMSNSIKSQALQDFHSQGYNRSHTLHSFKSSDKSNADGIPIGKLSSQFESGKDGIAAIGYDRVGGTSYGKYQIASRVGSMDNFLNFLDTEAPDLAKQLRDTGSANTGGRDGKMPTAWKEIAQNEPDRFEALQDKFIYNSHYEPALKALSENINLEKENLSPAMQEVLWSTAVQHGPQGAARIFSRAAEQSGDMSANNFDKKMINNIYDIRAQQFGSSTESVQASVRQRMSAEKNLALNLLAGKNSRLA